MMHNASFSRPLLSLNPTLLSTSNKHQATESQLASSLSPSSFRSSPSPTLSTNSSFSGKKHATLHTLPRKISSMPRFAKFKEWVSVYFSASSNRKYSSGRNVFYYPKSFHEEDSETDEPIVISLRMKMLSAM
jgi:hypothetical protein